MIENYFGIIHAGTTILAPKELDKPANSEIRLDENSHFTLSYACSNIVEQPERSFVYYVRKIFSPLMASDHPPRYYLDGPALPL